MCEVVIAFVDKMPSTEPLWPLNYLAFDILDVQVDGWPWTPTELGNTNWRFIKAPGVDPAVFAQFASCRLDVQGNVIRFRDWCFDTTQVPSAVITFLQNNQIVTLTAAQANKAATWLRKHSTTLTAS